MELSSEWNVLSDRVIGAAIEVHRHLGPGYLEAVYEEALLPLHKAQIVSYLKSSGAKLGLLINFNVAVLKNGIRRIVFT